MVFGDARKGKQNEDNPSDCMGCCSTRIGDLVFTGSVVHGDIRMMGYVGENPLNAAGNSTITKAYCHTFHWHCSKDGVYLKSYDTALCGAPRSVQAPHVAPRNVCGSRCFLCGLEICPKCRVAQ